MAVVIETTIGDITVDLFVEERPRACLNFIKLCKLKYYNLNLFHTVERDFIAQTGDPIGAGDGGESIWGVVEGSHKRFFEAESLPKIKHTVPGLLSLVSVGKFMVGSQFFFTLGSDLTSLDGIHCVIGEVVEGHEVLRQLNEAIVDEKFRPYQDIRVTHTVILDDPFSDPRGFQIPSRSPSPSGERLQNGRIGADEDIDDTEGKTIEEIHEMLAEREAKARATILEIVGDLPDADIAPPENVLFVCKLNPVTTDDDLEIIFSRFGKVKSCEVIRDKVSGDSLQYAFVEFEEQKSCEAAYFKMDNVLIDDRRIHVDFSQSVSKVQWRGKGRGVVHTDERDRKLDFNNLKNNKNRSERPRGGERKSEKHRSRSPIRKTENGDRGGRKSSPPSRTRSPRYDEQRRYDRQYRDPKKRSPIRGRQSPANVRGRSSKERQRSPFNKRRDYHDERRGSSPSNRRRPTSNHRRRSRSLEKNRPLDVRVHYTNRDESAPHSYGREHQRSRDDRSYDTKSRDIKDRSLPQKQNSTSRKSDSHTKKTVSQEKRLKSKKKHEKSKKSKKAQKLSSSDSDSSSATSTSSSSSTSEEERNKRSKKLKKIEKKPKKHSKKDSKRRESSSSD